MVDIKIEIVWGKQIEGLHTEIIDAWRLAGALPEGVDGNERVKQVVCVARNSENKILGITTAYLVKVEQLRNYLFAFRGMLMPGIKIPGLFAKMTTETINFLQTISNKIPNRPIGVIAEVENPDLKRFTNVVLQPGFVFIGYSAKGNPIRVHYFEGAKYE